jgi:tetratricopeptide (TPR) repeat protein
MNSRLWFSLPLLFSLSLTASAQGRPGRTSGSTTRRNTPTSPPPGNQRTTFITGRITVDDGTPVTDPVAIQTNCRGQLRTRGYSDSKGYFSIELSSNNTALAASSDASESMSTVGRVPTNSRSLSNEWEYCQIQANLPGYTSRSVELASKIQDMGPNDIGTIPLHRMDQVEGFTISATSAAAPSKAKKDFEKGVEQAKKGKLEEAQRELENAVAIYDHYAVAWVELGRVQAKQQNVAAAKGSFERAIAADAKLLTPYQELARMAMIAKDWAQLDSMTDKLLELNPVSFPEYWFYNAAANYYLRRLPDCEKSARQGLHIDTQHHIPKLEYLLATVLSDKHSYQEAAQHMRNFVRLMPPGAETDDAQKQAEKLEQLSAKADVAH